MENKDDMHPCHNQATEYDSPLGSGKRSRKRNVNQCLQHKRQMLILTQWVNFIGREREQVPTARPSRQFIESVATYSGACPRGFCDSFAKHGFVALARPFGQS